MNEYKNSLITVFSSLTNIEQVVPMSIDHNNSLHKTWKQKFYSVKEYDKTLWHTFSHNISKKILSGIDAINKFQTKSYCDLIIFSHENIIPICCNNISNKILFSDLIRSLNNIPSKIDIYISNPDFHWTFVLTHENEFGPYFSSIV